MKADMAVTDLDEGEAALLHFRGRSVADQAERARHPAAQRPNDAGSRPSHAFQQTAAVHRRRAE